MGAPSKDLRSALPALRRILGRLRPYVRPEWPLVLGGMVALFAEVAFRLLEPWPLKYVIDALVVPSDAAGGAATGEAARLPLLGGSSLVTLLAVCSGAIFAAALLRAVSSYLMTTFFAMAGSRAMTRVRGDVFAHLQRLSVRYHDSIRTGDVVTRLISDVGRLQDVAVTAMLPLLGNVVTLLAMVTVVAVLDWQLALIVLAAIPAFLLSSSEQGKKITVAARRQRAREGDLAGTAGETMGAITVVQAYSLEPVFQDRFAASNARSLKDGVKATRLSAGLERRTDVIVGLATAFVVLTGGLRVMAGALTPGELVIVLFYLKGAFKPMRDMAKYTGRIAKAAASGERILDVLDAEPDVADAPDARPAPRLRGEVRYEGVHVTYDGGRHALRGVDLTLAAGSRTGLLGPSGAGKSTLVQLLLRLQDPGAGRVTVDGLDLRAVTVASLRAQVAIVLQESVLFATTVRENIRYGDLSASDEEVERVARLANAHDFVTALPQGYDTVLSERGSTLSGGQRQRIAIARAMLRDAPIVVLDEATTGLDRANEQAVREALARLTAGRTTLVISHDVAAVRDCDVVVWIEGGEVVESGSPDQLLARPESRLATLRPLPQRGGPAGNPGGDHAAAG